MRESVRNGDILIGRRLPILNDGFVELIDYMGSDKRIADCARESYAKSEDPHTASQDEALIRRMLKNGHSSPFEQGVVVFKLRMPIFVLRQWVRHRTGRMNELSARYTKLKPSTFTPTVDSLYMRSSDPEEFNVTDATEKLSGFEKSAELVSELQEEYDQLIALGIPPELARINLPLSTYSEFYWQIDINNLMRFFGLRLEEHAQREITAYTSLIFDIVREVFPLTMKWFISEKFDSMVINREEIELLNLVIRKPPVDLYANDGAMSKLEKEFVSRIDEMMKKFKLRDTFGIGHGENPVIVSILENPSATIVVERIRADGAQDTYRIDGSSEDLIALSMDEYNSYMKYLKAGDAIQNPNR